MPRYMPQHTFDGLVLLKYVNDYITPDGQTEYQRTLIDYLKAYPSEAAENLFNDLRLATFEIAPFISDACKPALNGSPQTANVRFALVVEMISMLKRNRPTRRIWQWVFGGSAFVYEREPLKARVETSIENIRTMLKAVS